MDNDSCYIDEKAILTKGVCIKGNSKFKDNVKFKDKVTFYDSINTPDLSGIAICNGRYGPLSTCKIIANALLLGGVSNNITNLMNGDNNNILSILNNVPAWIDKIPVSSGGTGTDLSILGSGLLYYNSTDVQTYPVIGINMGGTGATTLEGAQTALGITSVSYPVTIDKGGTGATTLEGAQTALGITSVSYPISVENGGTSLTSIPSGIVVGASGLMTSINFNAGADTKFLVSSSGASSFIEPFLYAPQNAIVYNRITVTPSQLKTINSVPVNILPAPGANFTYVILASTTTFFYAPPVFTGGASVHVKFSPGGFMWFLIASSAIQGTLSRVANGFMASSSAASVYGAVIDQPIVSCTSSGADYVGDGGGSLDIQIWAMKVQM